LAIDCTKETAGEISFLYKPEAKKPNMKQTIKKEMENIANQLKKAN